MFFGVSFVIAGIVRSTGAVIPPLIILVIALWLVRIPFAYGFVGTWGADAIWWSFPIGSIVSLTLSVLYYRFGNWRQARMMAPTTANPPPQAAKAAVEPSATGS